MASDWLASYPQYLQLLGVGFLWINAHCAGMCGPLVIGLNLSGLATLEPTPNAGRASQGATEAAATRRRYGQAFLHLTAYQLGRAITLGTLGALAGWSGQVLQALVEDVTKVAGLVVAALLLGIGALSLARPAGLSGAERGPGRLLLALVGRLRGFGGHAQRLLLGMVLGFLPCMIPLWALGLAASTQSPLHGALLMVLMVAMTSIVIYGFGFAPALVSSRLRRWQRWLLPVLLMLSGLWLGLIAAAANGWIDHASFGFTLGGRGYTVMFW